MKHEIFFFAGMNFDFTSSLPKVDGKFIRSNAEFKDIFFKCLNSLNYKFSPIRPCPAILTNYLCINRRDFFCYVKKCILALYSIKDSLLIDLVVFELDGLNIVSPYNGKHNRLCVLECYRDNDSFDKHFCTIESLSACVSSLFCDFHYKRVVVS